MRVSNMRYILIILVFTCKDHLIIEGDPEYGMEVGTEITDDRVIQRLSQI